MNSKQEAATEPRTSHHQEIENALERLCENLDNMDSLIYEIEGAPQQHCCPAKDASSASLAVVLDTASEAICKLAERVNDQRHRLRDLLF